MSSVDLFDRPDLGPFDGDQERERVENAHLLRLLEQEPGWAVLERIVGGELAAWERRILSGALDQDSYRHRSGYVRGIRAVLDTPTEYQKTVRREQDAAAAPTEDEEQ